VGTPDDSSGGSRAGGSNNPTSNFRDPNLHLPISDQGRNEAEGLFEGILSVDFDDELFYGFNVLRVDLNEEPDEEREEDADIDEMRCNDGALTPV
jgi:hypothetical protein